MRSGRKSHSTRVRGLKLDWLLGNEVANEVALYTSAWIEIATLLSPYALVIVALYTSAWIEMPPTSGM